MLYSSCMHHFHKDILVITTGGTIDSFYDPQDGTPYQVPQGKDSAIPFALRELELGGRCRVHALCNKDSKDVGRRELYEIAALLRRHSALKKVIITHGTDTMPLNARALEAICEQQHLNGRTIIFTGAMEPLRDADLAIRPDADGWQNLRRAVQEADRQPAGSYIVINNQLHKAQDIAKQVEVGEDGQVIRSGFVDRIFRSSEHLGHSPSRNG